MVNLTKNTRSDLPIPTTVCKYSADGAASDQTAGCAINSYRR